MRVRSPKLVCANCCPAPFQAIDEPSLDGINAFVSGDSAYMDEDGYFFFQGRVDDVIMTSGERVGPFEVESKLLEHPAIVEAGVIGKPDPVRGEIIKAFVSLHEGYEPTDELKEDIQTIC